jgi:UDP-N-acetylmuramate-alanine ligase
MVQPEDIVLTLGAGSIYQAGEELLRKLEQGHAAC